MKSIVSGFFVAAMAMLVTWSPALATQECPFGGDGGSRMWGHGMSGMGGMHGGFAGPFMMILFFTALIVIAILLIKWLGNGHRRHRCTHARSGYSGKTPEDILKERFARGEIDKAEFEERRSVLNT